MLNNDNREAKGQENMENVVKSRILNLGVSVASILQHVAARYRGAKLDHVDSPRQGSCHARKHTCRQVDCIKSLQ